MGTEAAIGRYRGCYAALLRLYPRAFYARFGEEMEQSFRDLCRERARAGRGVAGLAWWMYGETLLEIIRENTISMPAMSKTILRVALGALGVLMVPIVASQMIEDWHWGMRGFVLAYVLFFGTGMAFALISRKMGAWTYKAGVGLALASGFMLGWGNMVHMTEKENPAFLVYFGVLVMGGVAAWIARLKARGMSEASFAMAAVLAAMAGTQLLLSGAPAGADRNQAIGRGVCVAMFAVSGLLFRRAAAAETAAR
jgi:hypothetical protein